MTELMKAISENPLKFLYAWILPSALAVGAFALIVFPAIDDLPIVRDIPTSGGAGGLVLGASCLAVGMVLALNSVLLYRVLEGYSGWPDWLYDRFRRRQVRRWMALRDRLRSADAQQRYDASRIQLLEEKLKQYPDREEFILPTRLGNAIKALETYGYERYSLDSQALWYELEAAAPEPLQQANEDARVAADFFVCSVYLLAVFSLLGVAVGVWRDNAPSLFFGLAAIPLVPFCYERAVKSIVEWQIAVQALVNVGRVKLAAELGLMMPQTLEEERRMWGALADFVLYGDAENETIGKALDRYRRNDENSGPSAQGN
jgi:hypothetical protein